MVRFDSLEELRKQAADWKAVDLTVGFTCGAFDILHAGHLDYLERARALCDRLIVAVNSDASVRTYKSPLRPIVAEEHRLQLVSGLRCVDATILMHDTRPERLLEELRPDLYIKGGDYEKKQLRSASIVESYGGRCVLIPVQHQISTSALVSRIETLARYSAPIEVTRQSRPIVFLDRDGTLIENVHFLNTPSRVKLLPGVGEGMRVLQDFGYSLVVITNQGGLGLGYFDYDSFVSSNSEMLRQLGPYGVNVTKFYFCPHSAAEECSCRKPKAGLLERALAEFKADATECFMIGDSQSDVAAAASINVRGIWITDESPSGPFKAVKTFTEAVDLVLASKPEVTICS